MDRWVQALCKERGPGLVALAVRSIAGGFFVVVSLGKFFDHASETHDFDRYGLPFPAVAVLLAGIIELCGGLALIVGVGTRVAAAALAANLVVAIATAGRVEGGRFNLGVAPALLLLLLVLLWTGPGTWSVDRALARRYATSGAAADRSL
jgi:putative oxidoreductase